MPLEDEGRCCSETLREGKEELGHGVVVVKGRSAMDVEVHWKCH